MFEIKFPFDSPLLRMPPKPFLERVWPAAAWFGVRACGLGCKVKSKLWDSGLASDLGLGLHFYDYILVFESVGAAWTVTKGPTKEAKGTPDSQNANCTLQNSHNSSVVSLDL